MLYRLLFHVSKKQRYNFFLIRAQKYKNGFRIPPSSHPFPSPSPGMAEERKKRGRRGCLQYADRQRIVFGPKMGISGTFFRFFASLFQLDGSCWLSVFYVIYLPVWEKRCIFAFKSNWHERA